MSQQSLISFLSKLEKELETNKAGAYRKLTANLRPHLFTFNAQKISQETQLELHKRGIPVSPDDKKKINELASDLKSSLEAEISGLKNTVDNPKLVITKFTIRYTFTSNTVTKRTGQYSDPDSVFDKIKDTYRPHLQAFFNSLQEYLVTQTFTSESGREKTKAFRGTRAGVAGAGNVLKGPGRVYNAGHVGESGVLQSMIADVFNNLSDSFGVVDDNGNTLNTSEIKKDLEKLGINLSIIRDSKTDSHTIAIESATDNKARGAEIRKDKDKLIAELKSAIAKIKDAGPGLIDLKGSDSIRQKKRKETVDAVIMPLAKMKRSKTMSVKIKQEDTKQKKSVSKPQKKSVSISAEKGKHSSRKAAVSVSRGGGARESQKKGVAASPLALIAEFNRRLPSAIIANMGSPALNNQTGRFASSVKVVDILQTNKGFPSVGYTYEKNPYQTFEVGYRQGSLEQDPRKLIDRTIREIAVEFAMGRLFTRRV